MVAQAFEGFPLAARLLKDFLLLVAQVLPAHEIRVRHPAAAAATRPRTGKCEAQFGGGGARSQFLRFTELNLPDPLVELLDHAARPRHLLVGRAQTQFLLVFDALPEVKIPLAAENEKPWVFFREAG